ncbi:hypothetical protein MGLY_32800 [Neomoorella glycerini]|uniref:DUF4198 domain-containing protein n=1 Tax=Neomoorella glycerini TaxID=55779 RepID=A0A6I5ZWM4_9FIRM|nr:DUF4198 domain-containing protein [Moorella glycerini]QGP93857.1 hypothetical protein MGLY_32800 [Moorella glycerini]
MAPHNIWIECPHRARAGEELTARIGFGHNFIVQGKADPLRTGAWLFTPGGKKVPLAVDAGEKELTVAFVPGEGGVYTLLCEYDGKIWSIGRDGRHLRGPHTDHPGIDITRSFYAYQFAKTFINVETDYPWPGPLGLELEIVPQPPARGQLEVAVLYEGRPLKGISVQAFRTGDPSPYTTCTGAQGMARFPFTKGSWMILTNYANPQKGVPGQYNERYLTAIFTLKT